MADAFDDYALSLSPWLYLRLDDTSGTSAVDASGNSQTGTYVDSPTLNQSPISFDQSGRSVKFNGSSQYITVPHHANFDASELTVVALLSIQALPDASSIFQHGDTNSSGNEGYSFYATSDRRMNFCGYHSAAGLNYSITTNPFFSLGEIFLYAANYAGSVVRFYKNGRLIESVTFTPGSKTPPTNPQTVNIGAAKNSTFRSFLNTYMSRVLFFTSSLTAGQIKTLYENMIVSYRGAPLEVGKPLTQQQFTKWGH